MLTLCVLALLCAWSASLWSHAEIEGWRWPWRVGLWVSTCVSAAGLAVALLPLLGWE